MCPGAGVTVSEQNSKKNIFYFCVYITLLGRHTYKWISILCLGCYEVQKRKLYVFIISNPLVSGLFILAALGLCCCMQPFSGCGEGAILHLQCVAFSLWWLLLLWSMDLVVLWHVKSSWTRDPTPGLALAGKFLTTGPRGKSSESYFKMIGKCSFLPLALIQNLALSYVIQRTFAFCTKWTQRS